MDNLAIVIFSADINNDLWEVNDILINRYWPSHPPIYLLTETKTYKNFKTINFNYSIDKWTKRIRKSLAQIQEDYIIFMCDDIFIRTEVNERLCAEMLDFMRHEPNAANINFELSFDKRDIDCKNQYLKFRPKNARIRVALLCGLWNRKKLISLLQRDCTPWEIEKHQNDNNYDYYILKNKKIITWICDEPNLCGGIFQGKWHSTAYFFLMKEGIDITKLHNRKEVD